MSADASACSGSALCCVPDEDFSFGTCAASTLHFGDCSYLLICSHDETAPIEILKEGTTAAFGTQLPLLVVPSPSKGGTHCHLCLASGRRHLLRKMHGLADVTDGPSEVYVHRREVHARGLWRARAGAHAAAAAAAPRAVRAAPVGACPGPPVPLQLWQPGAAVTQGERLSV